VLYECSPEARAFFLAERVDDEIDLLVKLSKDCGTVITSTSVEAETAFCTSITDQPGRQRSIKSSPEIEILLQCKAVHCLGPSGLPSGLGMDGEEGHEQLSDE